MFRLFAFVLLGVCLEFGAVVGILYLGYHHDATHKAEAEAAVHHETIPPHRSDLYREWYLRSLWDIHDQTPDSRVLAALYGRSDGLRNYVVPRTDEDFDTAKTRILSPLGPDPSELEFYTAVTVETYAVGRCAERYDQRCYTLDFTHWAVGSHVLAALGRTTAFSEVMAGDYSRPWADWTIPRPFTPTGAK